MHLFSPLHICVKWFDSVKGFGFVNIYGKETDVFIHIEILRRSGLTDLQAGEAVALRVIDGRRVKMAAEERKDELVR